MSVPPTYDSLTGMLTLNINLYSIQMILTNIESLTFCTNLLTVF